MSGSKIKVGIIGGTGLDNPDLLSNRKEREVKTLFGAPSEVLVEGDIGGVPCVLLSRHGKKHTILPGNINYRANIWALKEAGCTHVIATAAVGSLKEEIAPGDIVIPDGFIDSTKGRMQTFRDGNPNSPQPPLVHLPVAPIYCEKLRLLLAKTCDDVGLEHRDTANVVVIEGPRYNSVAESNMYINLGGDVVSMTIVPEVVLAKEACLLYVNLALVTDYDSWKNAGEEATTHDAVEKMVKEHCDDMLNIIKGLVPAIAAEDWEEELKLLRVGSLQIASSRRTRGRKQTFYDGEPGSPEGIVHLPMEPAYSEPLRKVMIQTAEKLQLKHHKSGTVVVIEGPRFSSKAESKVYISWNADIINMTVVPEVVLAKEAGLLYTTVAIVTDYDCWREEGEHVTHSNVLKAFQQNIHKVIDLIVHAVTNIGSGDWEDEIKKARDFVEANVM